VKIRSIIVSGLLAGLFFSSTLTAGLPVYRKGCEFPLEGVQVCWEARAGENTEHAPYPELHMLPITRLLGGDEEVLVDTTRQIYRQMVISGLAERLIPEWEPVFHLEEAMLSGQEWGWPAYMWIAPRAMRNSSEMSPGVVDWDVYFFAKNRLDRTLRIRVESKPIESNDRLEIIAATGAALLSTAGASLSLGTGAATVAAGTMASSGPQEAGSSLEIMTELATRQVLFLAQFPIEELNPPDAPLPKQEVSIVERLGELTNKIFAPK
jgi:hypothetical protein